MQEMDNFFILMLNPQALSDMKGCYFHFGYITTKILELKSLFLIPMVNRRSIKHVEENFAYTSVT